MDGPKTYLQKKYKKFPYRKRFTINWSNVDKENDPQSKILFDMCPSEKYVYVHGNKNLFLIIFAGRTIMYVLFNTGLLKMKSRSRKNLRLFRVCEIFGPYTFKLSFGSFFLFKAILFENPITMLTPDSALLGLIGLPFSPFAFQPSRHPCKKHRIMYDVVFRFSFLPFFPIPLVSFMRYRSKFKKINSNTKRVYCVVVAPHTHTL